MASQEPFLSRPRIRKKTDEMSVVPHEEIIEGVIEEEYPSPIVPPSSDKVASPPYEATPPRKRRRLGLGIQIADFPLLLLTLAMILGGIFFTWRNVATLPAMIEAWYPLLIFGGAILWSLVALVRQEATAFLGGAAVGGFSLSLLLQTQSIALFEETVVGVMLITVGMAIVIRGLLMRQQWTA